jgi:hypothetical protein
MFQTVSLLGIDLTIDVRLRWANELLAGLSDVIAVSRAGSRPLSGSLRIEQGNVRAVRQAAYPLEPGIRRTNEGLLDEEYGVLVSFPSSTEIVLRTDYSCPEWFSWSLQLQALRNRATFVHSAGVELNGTAVLLAARNGFGKTALIGDFMRRAGWRLLGDDLTLLSADGTCYGYPRALVVHPEHKAFFPELFAHDAGPSAPRVLSGTLERAGRMVKPLLRLVPGLLESARRHNPQTARITPTAAFARERIVPSAPLAFVVSLERRSDISHAQLLPLRESLAARLLGSTIDEFDARCVRISNVAMALGLLDLETTYGAWIDVLRAGLVRVRSYTLCAPATLPLEEMPAVVHDLLAAAGIGAISQTSSCA